MSTLENPEQSFFGHLSEIVELILRKLPAKALRVTARVNRMWKEISTRILCSRSRCSVHYFPDTPMRPDDAQELFENLFADPKVVIYLSHRESWLNRRDPIAKRTEERHLARAVRLIISCIPPGCILLGCTTERILLEERDEHTDLLQLEHKRSGHGLICLPNMEGVTYYRAYLRQFKPSREQNWAGLFGVEPSTPVKMVILTALSHSRDYIPHIAAGIRMTYGPRVVILGAVAHDRLFIDGLVKRTRVTALFIAGDNFRACAKFISNERDADFYERIDSLMHESVTDGYEPQFNVLITSRFISRGNAFYINSLTAFRRPFSLTPVLGLYSFGEFCLSSKDVGKSRVNACKRFMKHNAAIFCACSYKKRNTLS